MTHRMVLLASLLTLVSATAAAQRPLTLSLAGGASLPVGRFGDAASTGWHALASIGLSTLMQPIGLRLDVAHNRFTAESVGPDQGVTSATLNATYRLPMTNSPLSPYLITGAGASRFECFGTIDCGTATRFGWNEVRRARDEGLHGIAISCGQRERRKRQIRTAHIWTDVLTARGRVTQSKVRNEMLKNRLGIVALLVAALVGPTTAGAQAQPTKKDGGNVALNRKGVMLREGMRKLWSDHVVWTRNYIVSAVADDPSASAAAARLMKNQEDLGTDIVPYYGSAAGSRLTALLKDHINIAVDLVPAAKAGDNAKVSDADKRWHQNAADIATFLSGANPRWTRESLVTMLNEHLKLTTEEAKARIQKRWT